MSDIEFYLRQDNKLNLDCRGKPEPKLTDRFVILGREQAIIGITQYSQPRLTANGYVTHTITFRDLGEPTTTS